MAERKRVIASLLALLCVVGHSSRLIAQTSSPSVAVAGVQSIAAASPPTVLVAQRFSGPASNAWSDSGQPALGATSRDSLRNGAIVGAVIGAVAFGALAGTICKAEQEPGGPSCVPDILRVAAIGAAIGVGAGLVIDVARSRDGATVRLSLRF